MKCLLGYGNNIHLSDNYKFHRSVMICVKTAEQVKHGFGMQVLYVSVLPSVLGCCWLGNNPMYQVDMKSSGLSCEDAQGKDGWRLRIKANPDSAGKWPLKWCLCARLVCWHIFECLH